MADRRFNRLQMRMLVMTMIGNTLFCFLRKNFSFAMPGLAQELATKQTIWNTSHSIGAGLVTVLCGYIMGLGTLGSRGVGIGRPAARCARSGKAG